MIQKMYAGLWLLFAASLCLLGYLMLGNGPQLAGAVAVVSECGAYAILTVDNEGHITKYGADRQPTQEVEEDIRNLPPENLHVVGVPCPYGVRFDKQEQENRISISHGGEHHSR